MKLIEVLENIKGVAIQHPNIKKVSIVTTEDLITNISDSKNEYFHAHIVYDMKPYPVGEFAIQLPFSIIISDKLRTNDDNKIFIHSNTMSIAIDLISMIRSCLNDWGYDGLDKPQIELWTDQFSDSLLAGTKLEFLLVSDLGGWCDIKPIKN
jgi:hypothetical protein